MGVVEGAWGGWGGAYTVVLLVRGRPWVTRRAFSPRPSGAKACGVQRKSVTPPSTSTMSAFCVPPSSGESDAAASGGLSASVVTGHCREQQGEEGRCVRPAMLHRLLGIMAYYGCDARA